MNISKHTVYLYAFLKRVIKIRGELFLDFGTAFRTAKNLELNWSIQMGIIPM